MSDYKDKYLKYKHKYLQLKQSQENILEGGDVSPYNNSLKIHIGLYISDDFRFQFDKILCLFGINPKMKDLHITLFEFFVNCDNEAYKIFLDKSFSNNILLLYIYSFLIFPQDSQLGEFMFQSLTNTPEHFFDYKFFGDKDKIFVKQYTYRRAGDKDNIKVFKLSVIKYIEKLLSDYNPEININKDREFNLKLDGVSFITIKKWHNDNFTPHISLFNLSDMPESKLKNFSNDNLGLKMLAFMNYLNTYIYRPCDEKIINYLNSFNIKQKFSDLLLLDFINTFTSLIAAIDVTQSICIDSLKVNYSFTLETISKPVVSLSKPVNRVNPELYIYENSLISDDKLKLIDITTLKDEDFNKDVYKNIYEILGKINKKITEFNIAPDIQDKKNTNVIFKNVTSFRFTTGIDPERNVTRS